MNRVFKELDLDDKRYPVRQVLGRIHPRSRRAWSRGGLHPGSYFDDVVGRASRATSAPPEANAVDFDDLLLFVLRIVEDKESCAGEELRKKLRARPRRRVPGREPGAVSPRARLSRRATNLCVVGDDDQSIYRWRGADVRIVRNFRRDYPGARIVKLEQNYRSTATSCARARRDPPRDGARAEGAVDRTTRRRAGPVVACADSERDEAAFVVERVRELVDQGVIARGRRHLLQGPRPVARARGGDALRAAALPDHRRRAVLRARRGEGHLSATCASSQPEERRRSAADHQRPSRKIGDTTIDKLAGQTADANRSRCSTRSSRSSRSGGVGTAPKKALARVPRPAADLMSEARHGGAT
jgi:DNA helicase-2/ATP-dependent DNA helicase PcrA